MGMAVKVAMRCFTIMMGHTSVASQSVELIVASFGGNTSYSMGSYPAQSLADCQLLFLASEWCYRFALWCPKGCVDNIYEEAGECQYQTDLEGGVRGGVRFRGAMGCDSSSSKDQRCIAMRRTMSHAGMITIATLTVVCLHFLCFITWSVVSCARRRRDIRATGKPAQV